MAQVTPQVSEVLEKALTLSTHDRGMLIDRLIESLDEAPADEGVEKAWAEEIQHRVNDIRSGKVEMIPGEEVRRRLAARRQLNDARGEAARIIEEARQAADAVRRELISKAEADAEQVRRQAEETIRAQVERATTELRAQVATLAVESAELVLQRQLQDRDMQIQLVEDYINQVGAARG